MKGNSDESLVNKQASSSNTTGFETNGQIAPKFASTTLIAHYAAEIFGAINRRRRVYWRDFNILVIED
jgi:hypothetical protein